MSAGAGPPTEQSQPTHTDQAENVKPPVDISRTSLEAPAGIPFDPEPTREKLRGWLAIWVMGLLSTGVVGTFALFWFGKASDATSFAQLTVPSLIGIAGAVTGFYFASQQHR